jgi:hypothetical protein
MSANTSQNRRPPHQLFVVAALAAVVSLVITLSFAYADHSPAPHGVKLAIDAPVAVAQRLTAGLDRAAPGGFRWLRADSSQSAISLVRRQSAAGALSVPRTGPVTVVTAAAAGTSQQQAISGALAGAAAAMHRTVRTLDVAPLPRSDRAGLSSFVFELGLLIPSVIGSVGLFLLGLRFRIWWRVAAAALFSLLGGLSSFLVLDLVFGALTGSGVALIGVGVFGALSFVLTISALQSAFGMPGTGLAVLLLVFLGNAVSGGTVGLAFLPEVFRQLAPWVPNSAIVSAVRDVIYFSGNGLGHPLAVLGIWTGGALAVLLSVDLLHMSARRRSDTPAQKIHATPGLVLLRHRHGLT